MRKIGKVKNYNGVTGNIISDNKVYVFSNRGVFGNINNNDLVAFEILDDNDIVTNVRKCLNESLESYIKKYIKKKDE